MGDETMEKIKSLNRYQKGVLIFMIAMALVLPPSVIVGKQTALCVGGSRGYLAQAE